jgi:thiol-disulfide isomerase/thioredoxin
VRLSEQHDKLVFLTFWASWCPPCRNELAKEINAALQGTKTSVAQ